MYSVSKFSSKLREQTHSSFGHDVQEDVEPPWQEFLTCLGEIEARDTAQLDAKTLQENRKDIGHQDNEEQLELIRGTSGNICRVVSWINIRNGNL